MTPLETILGFIKSMNIKMLDSFLDDDITYQGAHKNIFLGKLSDFMDKLKIKGDVEIEIETGKCECPKCQDESKCGFVLIGNKSRNYLNLMIEIGSNDRIQNIYNCINYGLVDDYYVNYDFEFDNPEINVLEYNNIELESDELADFLPDDRYILIAEKCKESFEEIEKGIEYHIDANQIALWLSKYKNLADMMIGNMSTKTKSFHSLYCGLERIYPHYNFINVSEQACEEYRDKINLTKEELLNWLLKYENLNSSLVTFEMDFIKSSEDNSKWLLDEKYHFFFKEEDFRSIIELRSIFSEHYSDILDEQIEKFELEKGIKLNWGHQTLDYILNWVPF